jgi:hypothetical protein
MDMVYPPRLAKMIPVMQRDRSGPVISGKEWAMLLALACFGAAHSSSTA